MTYSKTLTG